MSIALIEMEWVHSPNYLLVCLVAGIVAALHLYGKQSFFEEARSWQRWLMAFLRALTVALLLALLLTPIVKILKSHAEQKSIVVLMDNSSSLRQVHDSLALSQFKSQLANAISSLGDQVNTDFYHFDEVLRKSQDGNYAGKTTNVADAIEQVKEQYASDRLAAIVLATDGIYNEGQNPNYLAGIERNPLYVIALGDTTAGLDVEVQRLFYNRVVYKGDEFEVEADISAIGLKNASGQVKLSKIASGKSETISTTPIRVDKTDFFRTVKFKVKASQAGVIRYRVNVPKLKGESNISNNYVDFYVEVIESRQKVLLLANSPHPDLNAIKLALTELKNYDVDIQYARQITGRLKDYNLVVLHNLPSDKYAVSEILKTIDREKQSVLFIVGSKTSIRGLNGAQDVVEIQQSQRQFTDAEPYLNTRFNLFSLNDELRQFSKNVPPLRVPFGSFSPHAGYEVLYNQEIKNVETNYPLIIMGETDGHKKGVITGEGIWKWRLYDFVQNQSFERSDELLSKLFQYISITSDRRRFKISKDKSLYDENDRIYLTAEFYNASYELNNNSDVELELTNAAGETSTFAFSKTENAYTLDLGKLAPGEYRYRGTIQDGGQGYSAAGKFTVQELLVEIQHIRADHQLLRNLVQASNGKLYGMEAVSQLQEDLSNSNSIKPLYISNYDRSSILNFKWLLALLLFLLSGEWFMRKYLGKY